MDAELQAWANRPSTWLPGPKGRANRGRPDTIHPPNALARPRWGFVRGGGVLPRAAVGRRWRPPFALHLA